MRRLFLKAINVEAYTVGALAFGRAVLYYFDVCNFALYERKIANI
jgi:hypothetical protein